jgi:hypothetical protein
MQCWMRTSLTWRSTSSPRAEARGTSRCASVRMHEAESRVARGGARAPVGLATTLRVTPDELGASLATEARPSRPASRPTSAGCGATRLAPIQASTPTGSKPTSRPSLTNGTRRSSTRRCTKRAVTPRRFEAVDVEQRLRCRTSQAFAGSDSHAPQRTASRPPGTEFDRSRPIAERSARRSAPPVKEVPHKEVPHRRGTSLVHRHSKRPFPPHRLTESGQRPR